MNRSVSLHARPQSSAAVSFVVQIRSDNSALVNRSTPSLPPPQPFNRHDRRSRQFVVHSVRTKSAQQYFESPSSVACRKARSFAAPHARRGIEHLPASRRCSQRRYAIRHRRTQVSSLVSILNTSFAPPFFRERHESIAARTDLALTPFSPTTPQGCFSHFPAEFDIFLSHDFTIGSTDCLPLASLVLIQSIRERPTV